VLFRPVDLNVTEIKLSVPFFSLGSTALCLLHSLCTFQLQGKLFSLLKGIVVVAMLNPF